MVIVVVTAMATAAMVTAVAKTVVVDQSIALTPARAQVKPLEKLTKAVHHEKKVPSKTRSRAIAVVISAVVVETRAIHVKKALTAHVQPHRLLRKPLVQTKSHALRKAHAPMQPPRPRRMTNATCNRDLTDKMLRKKTETGVTQTVNAAAVVAAVASAVQMTRWVLKTKTAHKLINRPKHLHT